MTSRCSPLVSRWSYHDSVTQTFEVRFSRRGDGALGYLGGPDNLARSPPIKHEFRSRGK